MSQETSQQDTDKAAEKEAAKTATEKSASAKTNDSLKQGSTKDNVSTDKKILPPKELKKTGPSSMRKGFKRLFLLLLLIFVAGLSAGGYWLYQNRAIFDNNFSQELAEQRELLGGVQRGLEREKEQRLRQGVTSDDQINSLVNTLAAQQQRVRELGGTSRTDWLLAEAEFLLRLGNQRLVIERDTLNAKALLENADVILRDLNAVDLLPVRKALARDITSLALVEKVDREGMYFKLSAIAEQVGMIPITPKRAEPADPAPVISVDDESHWQQLWHNFVSAISRLAGQAFRIQHHEKPVKPLLSVEQQNVVRSTLSLVFEQAQVALLRQEQAVYQQSLGKAQRLLINYYSLGHDVSPLVSQLEKLKEQVVEQPEVDISTSLEVLKTYIDNRHARHNNGEQGDQ